MLDTSPFPVGFMGTCCFLKLVWATSWIIFPFPAHQTPFPLTRFPTCSPLLLTLPLHCSSTNTFSPNSSIRLYPFKQINRSLTYACPYSISWINYSQSNFLFSSYILGQTILSWMFFSLRSSRTSYSKSHFDFPKKFRDIFFLSELQFHSSSS